MNQSYSKTPARVNWISALSLLGAIGAGYLSVLFYEIRSGSASFKSFCNISEKMNCDVVAGSPYAELISGFPISSFAGGWLLGLFVISLFARNVYWRREAVRFGLLIAGIGCLFTVPYLAVMNWMLKTFCIVCLVIDVVCISNLILLLSLKPEGFSQHAMDKAKWKNFGLLQGFIVIAFVGMMKIMDNSGVPQDMVEKLAQSVIDSPALSVSSSNEFPKFGASQPKITVVEFSDFQCPHCKHGAMTLHSLLNSYGDRVQVVHRNFPLDPACNPQITQSLHSAACESARVAHCANQQGKFIEVFQALFDHQEELAPGVPFKIAMDLKLDGARLESCIKSQETESAIRKDVEEGVRLGVQSTPTFFINGKKMEGGYPAPSWKIIFEYLLKQ